MSSIILTRNNFSSSFSSSTFNQISVWSLTFLPTFTFFTSNKGNVDVVVVDFVEDDNEYDYDDDIDDDDPDDEDEEHDDD